MLKGARLSVTRDYLKEIVAAKQKLLPKYKAERLNRNNKMSVEYQPSWLVEITQGRKQGNTNRNLNQLVIGHFGRFQAVR